MSQTECGGTSCAIFTGPGSSRLCDARRQAMNHADRSWGMTSADCGLAAKAGPGEDAAVEVRRGTDEQFALLALRQTVEAY